MNHELAKEGTTEKGMEMESDLPELQEVEIPVVVYHVITPSSPDNDYQYSLDQFTAHLQYLNDNGYNTLSAAEYQDIILNGVKPPHKPILLTFDDGTPDFYTIVYPLLKQYGMKATQFVVNDWIDREGMTSEQLQILADDPDIDLQNHTKTHPDLSALEHESVVAEITASTQYLEQITGEAPYMMAYPYGCYNDMVKTATQESGISIAFKVGYGITRTEDDKFALGRQIVLAHHTLGDFAAMIGGPLPESEEN